MGYLTCVIWVKYVADRRSRVSEREVRERWVKDVLYKYIFLDRPETRETVMYQHRKVTASKECAVRARGCLKQLPELGCLKLIVSHQNASNILVA